MSKIAQFGTAIFSAIVQTAPLLGGIARTQTALGSMAASMTRTGSVMTSAITLPLVGLGALAVSQSVKIENAWNHVRATYNATPAEVERVISSHGELGQAVDRLSTKYGINRIEVIELLGKLSQMGFTGRKATDALTQGLEFAVAAGIPLEEGLQTTITLTSTFGLQAQRMTEVLRGLNVIENETAANGEDLAIALRRAGGNAQALVSPAFSAKDAIASIAGAMAVFKANGQETFRSANALRAIFQRLYSGGPKVNEFFKQMGVSVELANGQLKPFPQLMREIGANWDKLTPRQQIEFMRSAIGIEFAPLFRLLVADIQKGAKGMSIFENSLKGFNNTAKGSAAYQRELAIRSNSLGTAIARVRAAFQKVVDQPGVREAFKTIADTVADVADAFAKASPQTQKWIAIILIVAGVIGPVLVLVGALAAAISAIGGTAFAVIGGVAALATAIVAFMRKAGPVQDFVKSLAGWWMKQLKAAWEDLKEAIMPLMPVFKIVGAIIGGVLLVAITSLVAGIRALAFVLKWLVTIVMFIVNGIVAAFKWLYNVLVGNSIIPDMVDRILAIWRALTGPLVAVVKAIANAIVAVWNWLSGVASAVWNGIVTAIKVVFQAWWSWMQLQFSIIRGVWSALWEGIRAVAGVIWTAITSVIKVAVTQIRGNIQTTLTAIRGIWNTIWTGIRSFLQASANAIRTIITTMVSVIRNLISAGMNAIRGNWSGAWNNIKSALSSITGGIRSIASGFMSAIRSTISAGMNAVRSTWSSAWTSARNTVSSIVNSIKAIVNSMVNAIQNAYNRATSILNSIKNAAGSVTSKIPGFNRGGLVPGTGNRDTVQAMLTPGEYVLTKRAVRRIGLANLNRLQRISSGDSVLEALGGGVRAAGALDGWSGALTASLAPDAAGGFRASVSANMSLPPDLAKLVGGNQVTVEFNTIVNNPIAEKSSDSINRRMAKTAQLGLIETSLSGALGG